MLRSVTRHFWGDRRYDGIPCEMGVSLPIMKKVLAIPPGRSPGFATPAPPRSRGGPRCGPEGGGSVSGDLADETPRLGLRRRDGQTAPAQSSTTWRAKRARAARQAGASQPPEVRESTAS
ncbi:hypothetical protein GCM10010517_05920 [Streptosporangium fragile]|uniref:Uncharacterized protein n=1 Tax=Streptosporangium fragile TaxID=46186 RepID=A0ABN3VQ06_9ACTN